MADLAILVPSRGRPQNVARLVEWCAKTCRTDYRLHFGFDGDDLTRGASIDAVPVMQRWSGTIGRMGLAEWTNKLAFENMDVSYLASIGDDMVPITDGWDAELIATIERDHDGTGFAYPNDGIRDDIPEAVVMSSSIVRALGWMALPVCHHFYIDDAWHDLGAGVGCITYRPDVIVEHRHWITGAVKDQTYVAADAWIERDRAAHRRWRLYQMPADVAKIKALR